MNAQLIKNIRKYVRLKMLDDKKPYSKESEKYLVEKMKNFYNRSTTEKQKEYREDIDKRIKLSKVA